MLILRLARKRGYRKSYLCHGFDSFPASLRWLPTGGLASRLVVGNLVKLTCEHERFWVKITEIKGDNLTGKIDNELMRTSEHGLKCGDIVSFNRKHIYDVAYERKPKLELEPDELRNIINIKEIPLAFQFADNKRSTTIK